MGLFQKIFGFLSGASPADPAVPKPGEEGLSLQEMLNKLDIHFSKLKESIWDVVQGARVAAWAKVDDEISLTEFSMKKIRQSHEIIRAGYSEPEYIALIRGKMESLFGMPSHRGDDYKNSFVYEIMAQVEGHKVYFTVNDRKANEISLGWEYTTSTGPERRVTEYAFWELLKDVPPADFEDAFAYDGSSGVRYGCRDGKPWVDATPRIAEDITEEQNQ